MTRHEQLPRNSSLREALHAALDLPPEARREFLARELEGLTLIDEALALLDGAEEPGSFLERPFRLTRGPFDPVMPGEIANYKLERQLGMGSHGVVYLAVQFAPKRKVAVKLLHAVHVGARPADRMRKEAEVLAQLSHPGIAPIYEAGVVDLGFGPQPWFSMEFVDGRPITQHAKEEGLDRRARVALLIEVARAVHHAHEHDVVHRDLKPDNVLVLRSPSPGSSRLRVLDFGIARWSGDASPIGPTTTNDALLGTLTYMAPEQAGERVVDGRADQFSLAAMLFELLTGMAPRRLQGCSLKQLVRSVAETEVEPASTHVTELAGDLDAILGKALSYSSIHRYPSVAAFADDLERWLAGAPTVARPLTSLERLARAVRRRPIATLVTATAVSIVAVVTTVVVSARVDEARARSVAAWFDDQALVVGLEEEVEDLWPQHSSRLAAMDGWLARAVTLYARLPAHRVAFAQLTSDVSYPASITQQGQALIKRIERLAEGEGFLHEIRARRARAADLDAETVVAHGPAWRAARERLADDARFAGCALRPYEGLEPLGPDPVSGLEEFAAFQTGAVPFRVDPESIIRPALGDALVFVLLPCGAAEVGFDERLVADPLLVESFKAYAHYGVPTRVVLEPYLLSKFEMTQDQWSRLFGINPSYNYVGKVFGDVVTTGLHPVDSVTWSNAERLLAHFQMRLPTEAQWECAARFGSQHPWIFGPREDDLFGYASLHWPGDRDDQNPPEVGGATDGFWENAPVGSFLPNPAGLYDILGNVWEHCRDDYKVLYHSLDLRPGDGLVVNDEIPDGGKSMRGGSYGMPPKTTHVFHRADRNMSSSDNSIGVRPIWVPIPTRTEVDD